MEFKEEWRAYLVLIFALVSEAKQYHTVAGPFRIVFRRMEPCIDQVTSTQKWLYNIYDSRRKRGEALKYSGNHTLGFDLDNTSTTLLKIASWSNIRGWQENAHRVVCKEACKCIEKIGPLQWSKYQNSVFGERVSCPYLAGIHRFENFTADLNHLAFEQFLYGKWRVDAHLVLRSGKVAGCMRIFADTVPD